MELFYHQMEWSEVGRFRLSILELANRTLGSKTYNEPWDEAKLDRKLNACLPGGLVMLAFAEHDLVGVTLGHSHKKAIALGMPMEPVDDPDATFFGAGLFVAPEYQGWGIGSRLIRKRLIWFRDRGCSYYTSITNSSGSHIGFYLERGYQLGQTINSPSYRNRKKIIKGRIDDILIALDARDPSSRAVSDFRENQVHSLAFDVVGA